MANFIVSADSSVDTYKNVLDKNRVYCITMKRVLKGVEVTEHFDSDKESDAFYETLKKGAMPTTVALNPTELQEYFEDILAKESSGDIVHVALSSGFSVTYDNSLKAAAEVNKNLKGRQVFVVDSLVATMGTALLVEELTKMRDEGKSTRDAINRVEYLRDHMQVFVLMSDLFHLKRGGRISGIKATIGTILNVKPIIVVNKLGKLVIENRMKGNHNAIKYVLNKMQDFGEKFGSEFAANGMAVARTSESKLNDEFLAAVRAKYPAMKLREGIIGPVIGSHVGCGTVAVFFIGAERPEIN